MVIPPEFVPNPYAGSPIWLPPAALLECPIVTPPPESFDPPLTWPSNVPTEALINGPPEFNPVESPKTLPCDSPVLPIVSPLESTPLLEALPKDPSVVTTSSVSLEDPTDPPEDVPKDPLAVPCNDLATSPSSPQAATPDALDAPLDALLPLPNAAPINPSDILPIDSPEISPTDPPLPIPKPK